MANHTHSHSHSHSHSHNEKKSWVHASKTCRLGTVLLLTIGFFFVELICGYILHSVAIVADAIHMLSDSGALIIAMVSVRVRIRRFSPKQQRISFFHGFRFRNESQRRTLLGK